MKKSASTSSIIRDVVRHFFYRLKRSRAYIFWKQAAVVHPGQSHIKRCITELGGKNAIIIDTVMRISTKPFKELCNRPLAFKGQKCSACSRAIVLEPVYDRFLERLVEATKSLSSWCRHRGPQTITWAPSWMKKPTQRILPHHR